MKSSKSENQHNNTLPGNVKDNPDSIITVAKGTLNPPVFSSGGIITIAIAVKNNSNLTVLQQKLTLNQKSCGAAKLISDSAMLFSRGKVSVVKITASENKISLEGINIPPRESVHIFYKVRIT